MNLLIENYNELNKYYSKKEELKKELYDTIEVWATCSSFVE
ncbi:hypothetical protein [Clostridium simiarum]|nr:hypothetical protein [Clostridium simiarum]